MPEHRQRSECYLHSDHAERLFSNASNQPLPKASWVCSLRITVKVSLGDVLLTMFIPCLKRVLTSLSVFVLIWPQIPVSKKKKKLNLDDVESMRLALKAIPE